MKPRFFVRKNLFYRWNFPRDFPPRQVFGRETWETTFNSSFMYITGNWNDSFIPWRFIIIRSSELFPFDEFVAQRHTNKLYVIRGYKNRISNYGEKSIFHLIDRDRGSLQNGGRLKLGTFHLSINMTMYIDAQWNRSRTKVDWSTTPETRLVVGGSIN